MPESLVIIPTFNERANIQRMVDEVLSLPASIHILIIDDGSPDGTGQLVNELIPKYPDRLFLIERHGKLGLGTAYIAGFKWALQHGYSYICEMDADFSHNPQDLMSLIKCVKDGADLCIGSRYKSGVNVVNWPIGRVIMSYYASVYVRLVTGLQVRDATAGFKCYHRCVLETIDFETIKFRGYAFQIEMKFIAWKHGFEIEEIPIVFTERAEGVSKMSRSIFWEAVWGVFTLKFQSWFRNYPQFPKREL